MPNLGILPRLPYEQTNIGALQSFAGGMRGVAGDIMGLQERARVGRIRAADQQVQSQLVQLTQGGGSPEETRFQLLNIISQNPESELGQKVAVSIIGQFLKEESEQFAATPWHQRPKYKQTPAGKVAARLKPPARAPAAFDPLSSLAGLSPEEIDRARRTKLRLLAPPTAGERLTPREKAEAETRRNEKRIGAEMDKLTRKLAQVENEATFQRKRSLTPPKDYDVWATVLASETADKGVKSAAQNKKAIADNNMRMAGQLYDTKKAEGDQIRKQIDALESDKAALYGTPGPQTRAQKVLTPEIVAHYLKLAGGNEALARQLAAKEGWREP